MSNAGGNYDRRRTTVSGPLPQIDQSIHHGHGNGHAKLVPLKTMKFPWSSPSAPNSPLAATSPASASAAPASPARTHSHRRTVSGNILARLNFLKDTPDVTTTGTPQDDTSAPVLRSVVSRKSLDDDSIPSPASGRADGATTSASSGTKTRRRKGSLRKTAILGGRMFTSEGRERKNSLLQRPVAVEQATPQPPADVTSQRPVVATLGDAQQHHPEYDGQREDDPRNSQESFDYEIAEAMSSSDSGWSRPIFSGERLSLVTGNAGRSDALGLNGLGSPLEMKSPTSQASYASASTTDDDDVLTFHRPAKSFADVQGDTIAIQKPLSTASTSYFPQVPDDAALTRRRSSKKSRSSPLSRNMTTLANFTEPEPHDYTETEYWGWVILFVTWLTFTVGMGSCLEIWSWAWDVGQTPYAPPELEDDETLPIVGYYPALIVLTGVVAWVWITVAWVGMKYFRHAKIEV